MLIGFSTQFCIKYDILTKRFWFKMPSGHWKVIWHKNYPSRHMYATWCGDLWRTQMASYVTRPFKKLNNRHLRVLLLIEGLVSCVLASLTHPSRWKNHQKRRKIAYKVSAMPTSELSFYIYFWNRRSFFFSIPHRFNPTDMPRALAIFLTQVWAPCKKKL